MGREKISSIYATYLSSLSSFSKNSTSFLVTLSKQNPPRKGFSIVELFVVLAIVGILMLAANVIIKNNDAKARDAQRMTDMELLASAVKTYYRDTGEVPNNIPDDLLKEIDLQKKLEDLYILEIPSDPLEVANNYRYVYYLEVNYGALPSHIFEFNAQLESPFNNSKETGDGGNVFNVYEVGSGVGTLGAGQTVGTPIATTCTSIQWGNTQVGSGGCAGTPAGLDCSSVPQCNGLTANICVINGIIVGGPDDGKPYTGIINGGNYDQVIVGTAGNDILNGDNAKDTICGLGGNDFLYGQNGQDFLDGGDGYDVMDGGSAPDTCVNGEQQTNC